MQSTSLPPHIHDFQLDPNRKHGRTGRCFTICKCGAHGQASMLTGKRFTTAKQVQEVKKHSALRTYPRQNALLAAHGYKTPQSFFDAMYDKFVASVYTDAA